MARHSLGVDWADRAHRVWVGDEAGQPVATFEVVETVDGLSEFGRWLDERRATGVELWAAIEKPAGRIVDFLLDHGVVVYPINPKALDRARDRFRMSQSKSDPFDAYVLAEFLRTDQPHLQPLRPSSPAAQELKLLTRDSRRLVGQQTRLVNQLTATLKEYYPRPLEGFGDLTRPLVRAVLARCPTPEALQAFPQAEWEALARAHRLGRARTAELWAAFQAPQLPVPAHVVRAKARLAQGLLAQLEPVVAAVKAYQEAIEDFFASMPGAEWLRTLPAGTTGTTLPTLWAELGDAPGRWASWQHLQAEAGMVPVTKRSGKQGVVQFRWACNKHLRYAAHTLAWLSLDQSEWARAYYQGQRDRGHRHHRALRALGAKWLKILFVMWRDRVPYEEEHHLATIARQHLRQAA